MAGGVSGPLLPPVLWEQIAAFLQAGNTGEISISVTRGRITGCRVMASWRIPEQEPEPRLVDIGDAVRKVQSSRQ
jgi:hypothetical protein